MIKYVVEKNRVIVRDISIPNNEWKYIMKRVLGKHYTNLQGNGPAWTFSSVHMETFQSELDKLLSSTMVQDDSCVQEEIIIKEQDEDLDHVSMNSQEDDTHDQDVVQGKGQYRYNIDDNILNFVRCWIQNTDLSHLVV